MQAKCIEITDGDELLQQVVRQSGCQVVALQVDYLTPDDLVQLSILIP